MASPYSEADHARRGDEKETDDWMEKRIASWRALHPTTTASGATAVSSSSSASSSSSVALPTPPPFLPGRARLQHGNLIFTSAAPGCSCEVDRQALLKDSAPVSSAPSCSSCCLHDLPSLPPSLSEVRTPEQWERFKAMAFGPADDKQKPTLRSSPLHLRTSLDAFLEKYKPSLVRADQASWIYVEQAVKSSSAMTVAASSDDMDDDDDDEPNWRDGYDEDRLQAEWAASPSKTAATLELLARRSGCLTGKWMIFREHSAVDDMWRRVAFAIVRGLLPGVRAAKVSSVKDDPSHVICIYTRDWTNRVELRRVRQALRDECGVRWKISYKADIYTLLGVYAKNPLNIQPTICTE